MTSIIDTNAFHLIFSNEQKPSYKEYRKWLDSKKGRIILGGKTYKKELNNKYAAILAQYEKQGKIIRIASSDVDKLEKIIKDATSSVDCDDQHIISLLILSLAKLICSEDSRAYPYFKDSRWFSGNKRPFILNKKSPVKRCRTILSRI